MAPGANGGTAETVQLAYPLDEFRDALDAEVEAASRAAASGAVSLQGGKRIGQVGSQYQYVFHVESPLNMPADSPGDLHVTGRAPVPAIVMSTEGLVVTLSLAENLGQTVPQARLRSDLAFLLRRLIDRIEGYADKDNPAGDRILGMSPAGGRPTPSTIVGLNDDQNAAVASALGRDTTFIWGPPGTGKTMTIGALGVQLFERGRSLLLVSHTNIAVDQAMLRIGRQLTAHGFGDELEDGKVLRVGEPQDAQLLERPELLLSEHARRRSEELAAEQDTLREERRQLAEQVLDDQQTLDLLEWVEHAGRDIQQHRESLKHIDSLRQQVDEHFDRLQQALDEHARLDHHADQARQLLETWDEIGERVPQLLDAADSAVAELRSQTDELDRAAVEGQRVLAETRSELAGEQATLGQSQDHGRVMRMWKGLPDPDEQAGLVDNLQRNLKQLTQELGDLVGRRDAARTQLGQAQQQQEALQQVTTTDWTEPGQLPALPQAPHAPVGGLADVRETIGRFNDGIRSFQRETGRTPEELLAAVRDAQGHVDAQRQRHDQLEADVDRHRQQLSSTLAEQFTVLRDVGILDRRVPEGLADKVELLDELRTAVRNEVGDVDAGELRARISQTNDRIEEGDRRLEEIEEALSRVEEDLVGDATIVATTLTRAYLRDYIQEREFDTVVLDEASMAPIPALWAAAGTATHGVVVVGDPKQLPPIKHSQLDIADKWLGRGIFEASGVLDRDRRDEGHLVQLTTQYRMHPDISDIPNQLVYNGSLADGPGAEDTPGLDEFYDYEWGPDAPVLLVDTEPLDAWVTTVDRGSSTSRLNFLSAVVSANLAEQILRDDRPPFEPGDRPRVLIVAPYRPQANLLATLVREQGLEDEVAVGTAHSFQGNEAPVVIFDLVVDEPHWRVGLFVPDYDEGNRRLLNVALTRAKSRLLVVGDFAYARSRGKKAFLGELVRHLDKHRKVPAHELLPVDLAARSARAQQQATGGPLVADEDRLIAGEDLYFRYLAADLQAAERRVVIYSPFLTPDRVSQVEPHLRGALARGVDVFVFTKPLRERPEHHRKPSRQVEDHLEGMGVSVLHKRSMHEKVVLIDDDISWLGSLNTLSFTESGEVMERRRSRRVVEDYIKHFRIAEIVGAVEADEVACPVCGDPLETAEGYSGPYWRCPQECFTRSPDKPYPHDGVLTCTNCGGDVEYGYWGDDPHWRCLDNRRHRDRVRKTHLRLPAMRQLVPESELRQLQEFWELDLA